MRFGVCCSPEQAPLAIAAGFVRAAWLRTLDEQEQVRGAYLLAKADAVPMTRRVNRLLEQGIAALEHAGETISEPPRGAYQRRQQRGKEEQ